MDPKQLNVCLEPFPCEYNKKTKYAPGTADRTFFASTTEINYRN